MWIMCASYYENIILLMALNILYNQAKFIFKYFYVTLYLAAFYWSSLPLIYISIRLYLCFLVFLPAVTGAPEMLWNFLKTLLQK